MGITFARVTDVFDSNCKTKGQVYSLISSLKNYQPTLQKNYPLVTGSIHSYAISTPWRAYRLAAILAYYN